jgi:hypothetical protein
MKTKTIFLWVSFAISIVLLVGTLVIFPLILKKSWWWFFSTLIFMGLFWIVTGIILLVNKWNSQLPQSTKIDPADAVKKVILMTKYDDDNADNLVILKKVIWKLGRKEFEPTPVMVILGKGTEKGQNRCFIINLNNPEKEISNIIDYKIEDIWTEANLIADHPADSPMTEKVTESLKFGVPTRTTERVIPSSAKEREALEKKEAEERTGIGGA